MKQLGITAPLKISAAALRKNIRKDRGGRYQTAPVLSSPKMLYLVPEATGELSDMGKRSINVTLRRSEAIYRLAAYFRNFSAYNASGRIRKLNYLSDSLFRSYTYLNRLTQALWSIYKSNNLQLSQSLLALIRTINKKNGTELDTYFEGSLKIVRLQRKMMTALKSIDHSMFAQLHSGYENSSVVKIGKQEIYRRSDLFKHSYEKTASMFSHITEDLYSMTPLLMRIYEGIETGVYLYSADTYQNAKTLRRLTNSLWKVYLGQNMELSRSFSRLITRVHEENKSIELRSAEYNMFSDSRSLKNLVSALRKAFSGSNLELRSSMISLFSDIHKAGNRKNIALNKHYDLRSAVVFFPIHREVIPENGHIRLEHRTTTHTSRPAQADDLSRLEREVKTKLGKLEAASVSASRADNTENIVREVLEKVNRKQQLDWRMEKLQRGIF